MDEKMTDTMPAEGTGYLQMRVTSAGGAFPIEDAVVMVLSDPLGSGAQSSVIRTLRTDASGLTETVPLPAPSRTLSQSPGNGKPYATYNIAVYKDGYYSVEGLGIPVFDGIVSTQAINLLPRDGLMPEKSRNPELVIDEAQGYLNLRAGANEEDGTEPPADDLEQGTYFGEQANGAVRHGDAAAKQTAQERPARQSGSAAGAREAVDIDEDPDAGDGEPFYSPAPIDTAARGGGRASFVSGTAYTEDDDIGISFGEGAESSASPAAENSSARAVGAGAQYAGGYGTADAPAPTDRANAAASGGRGDGADGGMKGGSV